MVGSLHCLVREAHVLEDDSITDDLKLQVYQILDDTMKISSRSDFVLIIAVYLPHVSILFTLLLDLHVFST